MTEAGVTRSLLKNSGTACIVVTEIRFRGTVATS